MTKFPLFASCNFWILFDIWNGGFIMAGIGGFIAPILIAPVILMKYLLDMLGSCTSGCGPEPSPDFALLRMYNMRMKSYTLPTFFSPRLFGG